MKDIKIVVADLDSFYLKQLVHYLMNSEYKFDVISYSKLESFKDYILSSSENIDVIMFSEEMMCKEVNDSRIKTKIVLSDMPNEKYEGFDTIQKYQKLSEIVSSLIIAYGEKTDNASRLAQGNKTTNIIGVYSPVGGCGKTTIALSIAKVIAAQNKRTFYLNMERIDSSANLLGKKAGISLSDLFVAIKTEDKNLGLALISKMGRVKEIGFSYVNPVESSFEHEELSIKEKKALITEIEKISQFDVVIIDFDSELTKEKIELLSVCDRIVMPYLPDLIGINKMTALINEAKIHSEVNDVVSKSMFVVNKTTKGTDDFIKQSGISNILPPTENIPLSLDLANMEITLRNELFANSNIMKIVRELV